MTSSSFIHVAAWSQHRNPSPSPGHSFGHLRSLSSIPSLSSRPKSPAKSIASNVTDTAISFDGASLSPRPHRRMPSCQSLIEDQDYSTIPDSRNRALSSAGLTDISSTSHHPDLDHEVAALSTKLIDALNHQTNLDDTLSATRQDLEASHERISELEALIAQQQELLSGDVWIRRTTVEAEKNKLLLRIAEEKKLRADVEREKKKIEQELETLTVSLFEEANNMVITAKEDAKREQEILMRKNEQLKSQLADTEGLLKSQQEQLAELKHVMEQMTAERDSHIGTAPPSPGLSRFDCKEEEIQPSDGGSQCSQGEPVSPTYPTSFSHLLQPVLRTDIPSYDDFISLVRMSKKHPTSRGSSGSYSGLNPLLGFTGSGSGSAPSNASTASLSTAATPSSNSVSPQTPNTPASALSSGSASSLGPLLPLKEFKFYKRVVAEDIEPTLRLDTAPGLSWLARRSVLNAMTEGTLVVEPVPTNGPFVSISKPQFYPCSLCGESRKDTVHLRNHRLRTSESDSAQRYPLCKYCLNRVRSSCDFLGFLRMVKDGHWRADDADSERAAWEESVKLREQMFWSRIGGGVVPAHQANGHGEKSPRNSHETSRPSSDGLSLSPDDLKPTESHESPGTSDDNEAHEITNNHDEEAEAVKQSHEYVVDNAPSSTETKEGPITKTRNSIQSLEASSPRSEKDFASRLSISIPWTFG